MNNSFRSFLVVLLMAATLVSCSSKSPEISDDLNESFRKLISIDDVNKSIHLRLDTSDSRVINFGSIIEVIIDNKSVYQAYFPVGFGLKLFVVSNNEWEKVEDKSTNLGDGIFLSPQNDQKLTDSSTTRFVPDFPEQLKTQRQPILLRVVVTGELIEENGTRVPVGAYVDVLVEP